MKIEFIAKPKILNDVSFGLSFLVSVPVHFLFQNKSFDYVDFLNEVRRLEI